MTEDRHDPQLVHPSSELLVEYCLGGLSRDDRKWVGAHVKACTSCASDEGLTKDSLRSAVPGLVRRRRAGSAGLLLAAAALLAVLGTWLDGPTSSERSQLGPSSTSQVASQISELGFEGSGERGRIAAVDFDRVSARDGNLTLRAN